MPSWDFVTDLLEVLQEQGFQYALFLFEENKKEVRSTVFPHFTTLDSLLAMEQAIKKIQKEIDSQRVKLKNKPNPPPPEPPKK